MENVLRRIIFGLAIIAYIAPLFVFPQTFVFPFIVPKVWFFRSIALLMGGAYVLLLLHKRKTYAQRFTPVHWAVLAFLGSYVISTIVGVDWHRSFWATQERMLGLFTLVHYILYFLVVSAVLEKKEQWYTLFRWILGLGGIVMVIALLQRINPALLLNRGTRSASTLGNPIYVGGYGMVLALIGYYLSIKEQSSAWRWYAIAGGFLGFLGMLASGTRGSILGFFSSVVVILGVYLICLPKESPVKKWAKRAAAVFAVLIMGLFFLRNNDVVQQIPGIGRVFTVSFESRTAQTRMMAWSVAVEGWQEHPMFGWGPNTFFYLFNKYYRPEFLAYGYQETWFDNAHNAVVNTLATQGVIGVITYMGIFLVPAWVLIAAYRRKDIDVDMLGFGGGFLSAHFVHNAFVFENPTSYIYLMTLLAYISVQVTKKKTIPTEEGRLLSSGIITIVSIASLLLVLTTNVNPARANHRSITAMRELSKQSEGVLEYYTTEVLSIPTPHYDDIRVDVARAFANAIGAYATQNRVEEVKRLFTEFDSGLDVALALHPHDIRLHIQRAEMYRFMASYAQDGTIFMQESEKWLREALTLSQDRQQIRFLLSANLIIQGRQDEAIPLMEEAVQAAPHVGESWWRYAAVYQSMGDLEKATEIILQGKEQGAIYKKADRQNIQKLLGVTASFTDSLKP